MLRHTCESRKEFLSLILRRRPILRQSHFETPAPSGGVLLPGAAPSQVVNGAFSSLTTFF